MEAVEQAKKSEWFILIGEHQSGPHSYLDMIRMLQGAELFDYNYIWAAHLEEWTPLAKVQDFSKDRLLLLLEHDKDISQAFRTRKSPRISKNLIIYGHNEERFFEGHSLDMGINGALVFLADPLLQPGHRVTLHFHGNIELPEGFNVNAEILRKNFSEKKLTVRSGLNYAIKFIQVQPHGEAAIKAWVQAQQETDRAKEADLKNEEENNRNKKQAK